MYLNGYSDYLTSFREPLLPPYRCHTDLKNVKCDHYVDDTMSRLSAKSGCIFTAKQGIQGTHKVTRCILSG